MRRVLAVLLMLLLLPAPAVGQSLTPDDCFHDLMSARLEGAALPDGIAWTLLRPNVVGPGWMGDLYDGEAQGARFELWWSCVPDAELFMSRSREALDAMAAVIVGTRLVGDDTLTVRNGGAGSEIHYLMLWRHGAAIAQLGSDSMAGDLGRLEDVAQAIDATFGG